MANYKKEAKSKITTIPIPNEVHKLLVEYQDLEARRYKTVSGKKGKRTTIAKLSAHIMKLGMPKFIEMSSKVKLEVEKMEEVDETTIHELVRNKLKQ